MTSWNMTTVTSTNFIAEITVSGCIIEGIEFEQYGSSGSGLKCSASSQSILNCRFISNASTQAGIGLQFVDGYSNSRVYSCYSYRFHLGFDCQQDYARVTGCYAKDANYGIAIQNCSYTVCSNNTGASNDTADIYGHNASCCIYNNNICPTQMRMFSNTNSIWDGNIYNAIYTSGSYPNSSCTTGSNELY